MTGIFLLCVVVTWFLVAVAIASRVGSGIPDRWRWLFRTAVFCVLLVLPVADEIVGGFQFRALCERNAVLWIDAGKAKGKTVRLEITPKGGDQQIQGTALPIFHSHYSYRILDGDEEVARYGTYAVNGGWLIRELGISNSNAPLTIGKSACAPEGRGMLDKTYGFTLIN